MRCGGVEVESVKVHKVLRLPRNLHLQDSHAAALTRRFASKNASKDNIQTPKRSFRTRLPRISENDPRVEKLRCTVLVTKLERHLRPPYPKCCACHGTTRAQSGQAPAAANQILRACAVQMHFEDFERHECTANRSELAKRPGATPRLDTGPLHLP